MYKLAILPGKTADFLSVIPGGGLAGKRFRKEVLYEGSFRHPSTGKTHKFSKTDLEQIANNSNTLLEKGVQIPFPDGHRFDAMYNMGNWVKFDVAPSSSSGAPAGAFGLFGEVVVPLEQHAERVGATIKTVSVYLERGVKLTDGTEIDGPVCTHVCGTTYPVVPGQSDFDAALAVTKEAFGPEEESETMNLDPVIKAAIVTALSLAKDTTDQQAIDAVKAAFGELKSLRENNATLLSTVNALKLVGPAAPATSLATEPAKTAREIALERQLLQLTTETRRSFLDAALAAGKISKVEADAFSKLSAIGEVSIIPFGKTDAEMVIPFVVIKGMIENREPGAAFSTGPRVVGGQPVSDLEAKKKAAKDRAAFFERRGHTIKWNSDQTDFSVVS